MEKSDLKVYKLVTDKNGDRYFIDSRTGKPLHARKTSSLSLVDRVKGGIASIKNATRMIIEDIETIKERDPAAKSNVEILLLYSGVHAVIAYRAANKLYTSGHYFSARAISQVARWFTGIEIHPGATIGKGLFIDHGMGVVIGETTEIGDNCTIYQGVTLGGTGKDKGKRHPTLGNNIMVGAGAKVLGPLNVGDNSKIAAGAVVLSDIPEHSTAVGVPARVVKQKGERVISDIDQIHLPDPTSQQLCALEIKILKLRKELDELKQKGNTVCDNITEDDKE